MYVLCAGAKTALLNAVVLVVALFEGEGFSGRVEALDLQTSGLLTRAISAGGFLGKESEIAFTAVPEALESAPQLSSVVFVGLGKKDEFNSTKAKSIGGKIFNAVNKSKFPEVAVLVGSELQVSLIADIAYGALDSGYVFTHYRTRDKGNYENKTKQMTFLVDNEDYALSYFNEANYRYEGMKITRDLATSPPNVLHPESYPDKIKHIFSGFDKVKVDSLDIKAMSKLGMNALLGVGMASAKESRLVTIRYNGDEDKDSKPLVFVGKGVTFDSGGLSIKPSAGMWEMKYDMTGSAVVVGLIKTLALRQAKVNVVGVLPIVENAVGGRAQRPSDVVASMSKQTIEVLNTDAEGRLILADAMYYAQETFNPELIIDIATLTGAVVVALGNHYAGCFSNNDELAGLLIQAGDVSGDLLWRFPLASKYDKMIDSDIADMKNIATRGSGADCIVAAQFLQRFVKGGVRWAHLDIAGVSWDRGGSKGASGFGVALLDQFISIYQAKKRSGAAH